MMQEMVDVFFPMLFHRVHELLASVPLALLHSPPSSRTTPLATATGHWSSSCAGAESYVQSMSPAPPPAGIGLSGAVSVSVARVAPVRTTYQIQYTQEYSHDGPIRCRRKHRYILWHQ